MGFRPGGVRPSGWAGQLAAARRADGTWSMATAKPGEQRIGIVSSIGHRLPDTG